MACKTGGKGKAPSKKMPMDEEMMGGSKSAPKGKGKFPPKGKKKGK